MTTTQTINPTSAPTNGANKVTNQKRTDMLEVVRISPAQAEIMLASNTRNRRTRPNVVDAYASDMAAGDWLWTGDPIRFAKDGTLIDGQHRLQAIIKSGKTIPVAVIRGLPPQTQEVMDRGVARQYCDVLALRGEQNATALGALIRRVWLWELGARSDAGSHKATTAQLDRVLDKHPELPEICRAAALVTKGINMSRPMAGLCWWVFASIDQEDADYFMLRLGDGQALVEGDPIFALRKLLLAGDPGKMRGLTQKYTLAITIKAWNAYREGTRIQQLRWRAGGAKPEPFPEPV